LEQLRQRVYELTAKKEAVPGMLDIETQLAQLGVCSVLLVLINKRVIWRLKYSIM